MKHPDESKPEERAGRKKDLPGQLDLHGNVVVPPDKACDIVKSPLAVPKRESNPIKMVRSVFNLPPSRGENGGEVHWTNGHEYHPEGKAKIPEEVRPCQNPMQWPRGHPLYKEPT